MADHVVQAVLTLAMWYTLWALWYPLNRVGAAAGQRIGRWQLDRMHQAERLHGLQLHLELLRCSPLMVGAAMEQEMERHRRRLSEGGYDWRVVRRMPEWAWTVIACVVTAVVVGTVTYLVTVWYLTKGMFG